MRSLRTKIASAIAKRHEAMRLLPHYHVVKALGLSERQIAAFTDCYFTLAWFVPGLHWGLVAAMCMYNVGALVLRAIENRRAA